MSYNKPLKVGDIVTVCIENLGEKGDGIARYENFAIIIPHTEIDKAYKVRIKKVFPTFCIGELMEKTTQVR